MPGTIHVSVIEVVGLPQPSSMCIKVSMGRQVEEMQGKEETSFSVATLRDNLNVTIHDSEGNVIAHTDVEIRSIVEKVMWDDLFPLKGGGNIHMRLHFILTEVEQNRIRSMRESAARKKNEDLLKRRHSSTDLEGASGGSPAYWHDSLKSRYRTEGRSVDFSGSQANKISAESNVQSLNKAQPDQNEQAFSTSKSAGSLDKLLVLQNSDGRFQGQGANQQNQLDKTPSNNEESSATTQLSTSTTVVIPPNLPGLKKTIAVNTQSDLSTLEALSTPEEIGKEREKLLSVEKTAAVSNYSTVDTPPNMPSLEKMVVVDTKPALSKVEQLPAPSTSEENDKERGDLLRPTNTTKEPVQLRSNTRGVNLSNVPNLQKIVAVNAEIPDEKNISKTQQTEDKYKEKNSLKQLHMSPLSDRNMFSLKKILEALSRKKKSPTENGNKRAAAYDPIIIEKKWRSKKWKSYQHTAKPKVFYENESYSGDSWIFLDETISSCVLSDDRPFVDVQEGYLSNCNRDDDQEKVSDTDVTQSKMKKSNGSNEWESKRRWLNNMSFPGSAGQAVKIAIMAGFGLLVLLTRQKKSRYNR